MNYNNTINYYTYRQMATQKDANPHQMPEEPSTSQVPEEKEASPDELEQLQKELDDMQVAPVAPSTVAYYIQNKDDVSIVVLRVLHVGEANLILLRLPSASIMSFG